ncbi:MobP2 family relaxase [Clostridium perfringens]|uniref:MobP2 family relaxase n=1 Tax=Clostridium perfringens TaxID=1502 RepID=UPI0013E2FE12|nr:MobP2 family relaxase [Clostridium perfringens]MDK0542278.1 MobP2 family relaxase [Clostridium perfringens]MDK0672184.1 MobP2 family relaxase [Clostridium perfringens]MDK0675259.1 MobP2 family relaxase [Clostridium perfringens]MDK0806287.1 MobP2 family relaxase [Clostridium perfringens]MDK0832342.1 MobP2 family relaxase [Clostridium perfringens]
MVGVINKVKFIRNGSSKFKNFIDYIDRSEATRKKNFDKYSAYNNYMGNPEKIGSLFTKDKHSLTEKEVKKLKKDFDKAQSNGSNMWQEVFSFDNEFLEVNGLYDSENGALDEEKIQEATRRAMEELSKREGFKDLTWSASLHYNTDNIHVHIASVEINPSRERGKFKPKTLYNMKSSFVNSLLDKQKDLDKINLLIRDNLIQGKKEMSFKEDIEMRKMVKEIVQKLPSDKRQWHYNYNSMQEVRPLIDNLTKYYIETYKKDEFKELVDRLEKEDKFYKEVYGKRKVETTTYKDNKIQDLYTRMGNTILKEIKEYVKEEDLKSQKKFENLQERWERNKNIIITKQSISMMKKSLNNDINSMKNQREYEKLQSSIEYDM